MTPYNPYGDPFKIREEIGNWKNIYESLGKSTEGYGPDQKIFKIIGAFEEFCQDYIALITEINTPDKGESPQPGFSPDWLNNRINYALLEYWEPILKAIEQHQVKHYRGMLDSGYTQLRKFTEKRSGWLKFDLNDQIVFYFDKTGKYKRYPFGGIFLIGIPLMDAYRDDWMAVPHEIGHHIYRNSRLEEPSAASGNQLPQTDQFTEWSSLFDREIENTLSPLLGNNSNVRRYVRSRLENWSEEIFADIVGVKIAGEEFVEAAWSKVAKSIETPKELFMDDNDHPVPFFRPFIRDVAFGRTPNPSRWATLFPGFASPEDLQNASLQTSLGKFVQALYAKLPYLTVVREEIQPVMGRVKGTVKEQPTHVTTSEDKTNLVKLLLNLYVHEEGEDWTCSYCGTANAWWRLWCSRCGALR